MARSRKARQPKIAPETIAAEDESQDTPEPEGAEVEEEDGPVAGKTISKAEAIRRVLAEGIESPEDATDFIKTRFGLDVSRQHFSASKSQIRSKEGEARPAARSEPVRRGRPPKVRAVPPVESHLAPSPRPHADLGESELLLAMEAMKPLVASLGADRVKRLADLLS